MSNCIIAGSFDPFTDGHEELVRQACDVFDNVMVVVADNSSKKYLIETPVLRKDLIRQVLVDRLSSSQFSHMEFGIVSNTELLATYAKKIGVTHLVRGVRNLTDYAYELDMQYTNSLINPKIQTVYFFASPEKAIISSSKVKMLMGCDNWTSIVSKMVHPLVLQALQARANKTRLV